MAIVYQFQSSPIQAHVRAAPLTRREAEVAKMVATGATSRSIANDLCVSLRTVNNHLQSIYLKLQVNNRTQLALMVERGTLPVS